MPVPRLIKATPVLIRELGLNERWIQEQLVADPAQLGLGDVFVKDKERSQPRAGRLDMLLEESEDERRYEVELQLGATDESHIIRCIEYWDLERSRFPQYEHTAVLVAESVTSRFLNVIRLFNGQIPIMAIQMQALRVDDAICLTFVRVVDELRRGLEEEETEASPVDRKQWESRLKPEMLGVADRVFEIARRVEPKVQTNYLQGYWGVRIDGKASNFFAMSPRRKFWILGFRHPKSPELEAEFAQADIDLAGYTTWGAYEIRLFPADIEKHAGLLERCLQEAYRHWTT